MNTQDILAGGTIEKVSEDAPDTRPTVTHDEYIKLATLKAQQKQLKENGFDASEFISGGKAQIAAAEEKLAEIRTELNSATEEFQGLFNEVTTRYGLTGNVNIDDTEPHYIYETPVPDQG
jgi:hypothetical protein